MLELSDTIRELAAPHAIMAAATAILQRELTAAWIGYAEVNEAQTPFVIPHEVTDGSVPPMAGRHPLATLAAGGSIRKPSTTWHA